MPIVSLLAGIPTLMVPLPRACCGWPAAILMGDVPATTAPKRFRFRRYGW